MSLYIPYSLPQLPENTRAPHQPETRVMRVMRRNGNRLLHTSGKSTRLLWLQQELEYVSYVMRWSRSEFLSTFEDVPYLDGTKEFWESLSKAVDAAAAVYRRGSPNRPTTPISSRSDFLGYFRAESWEKNVVLLIDDFSILDHATSDVRDDCIQALRELKDSLQADALQCLIAAGTYQSFIWTRHRPPVFRHSTSLVLSRSHILAFMIPGNSFMYFRRIYEDVWGKLSGHPGMVCICGPYPSLLLLQSHFVGFLEEVELKDQTEEDLANFLTSEGVLLKPDPAKPNYRMASGLVDVLIRTRLIPLKFRDAPSSALPLQNLEVKCCDGTLHCCLQVDTQMGLPLFSKDLSYELCIYIVKFEVIHMCKPFRSSKIITFCGSSP
ncbi:hypothetical protein JOM56_000695 [Amanita muscaria]